MTRMTFKGRAALGAMAAATVLAFGGPVQAEIDERKFETVGNFNTSYQWLNHEKPMYDTEIPEMSGGKLTFNAVSWNELGMSGFEILRLLKLGTYDIAALSIAYSAADSPLIEGGELAGTIPGLDQYHTAMDAYRDAMNKEFEERFNSKILVIHPWTGLQLFCNLGDRSITEFSVDDLSGLKIRGFSASLSDLIEGLGASSVTISFAEVVSALEKRVADCAITGMMNAYEANFGQVVTHNIRLDIGNVGSIIAMNLDTWNSLSAETQALLTEAFNKIEAGIWEETAEMNLVAADCNAQGPCPLGEIGGMTVIEPSAEDAAKMKEVVQSKVLPSWGARCTAPGCVETWNDTIGEIVGLSVEQ